MIHLLFTGGTISMQRDERAGGNVPVHGGDALVGMAPELRAVSPFRIDDWGRYPACHMGPEKLWELRNHVQAVQAGEHGERPRGIVITHGTDTIEETAYLLARTLDPAIPVVITGAMRTADQRDWDGPRNLTDSARVAVDPSSCGRGTMVVFAGKIFDGREVAKVEATDLVAFDAPHGAGLGRVEQGIVEFRTGSPRGAAESPDRLIAQSPHRPIAQPPSLSARVALIPMVIGDRGELLDLARPTHDGVVIAAFGSGNLPPGAVPAIHRWLDEGKPVVLGTRCPRGAVTPVYAFPGGGATLVREGVIPAGARTLAQARMELVIAISAGVRYGEGERGTRDGGRGV